MGEDRPDRPMVTESFHSQHSPFGAFASFTVGLVDAPGGFGQGLRGPAKQNVYVGYRSSGETNWSLLPFFAASTSMEFAFTGETSSATERRNITTLRPTDYQRTLKLASDTWRADNSRFGFSLLSPFGKVPDPAKLMKSAARFHLTPQIPAWIEYDNREGTAAVELIFGLGDTSDIQRPLIDRTPKLLGFAGGRKFGYATVPARGVSLRQGFNVLDPKFHDVRGLMAICGESGIVFKVPAGQRRRFPLSLGFFSEGTVTTGLDAEFAYTQSFRDLEDVLLHGLAQHARYVRVAAERDRELEKSKLDADQQFLIAQAVHSYLGSSQLLWRAGKPLWVVNEGEYRMINTFDLTVDHLFFELIWHPWAVRNVLDLFVSHYSYTDQLGLSFTHDMGVNNYFTPKGRSSYECDDLEGCFSHMTMEQLLNWVLCATTYAEYTGDYDWLSARKKTLLACAESMLRRDDPKPNRRDGILKHDSSRCGEGSEITTYDSLDVSLGQARNNLYLAVKTLGAWILLEHAFDRLGLKTARDNASTTAGLLARTLSTKFEADTGFFPAVFEKENHSRILPAVEGFVYPLFLGYKDATDLTGPFGVLLGQLRQHIGHSLQPGVCLDEASGAWKMSSTSTNTWFSKTAIAQHVIRRMFPETITPAAHAGDRIHAQWQRTPGCGVDAMCDQIRSDTGVTCGSRYYPRGVTAWLWLLEK